MKRNYTVETCDSCDGHGTIIITGWRHIADEKIPEKEVKCPRCNGTGVVKVYLQRYRLEVE